MKMHPGPGKVYEKCEVTAPGDKQPNTVSRPQEPPRETAGIPSMAASVQLEKHYSRSRSCRLRDPCIERKWGAKGRQMPITLSASPATGRGVIPQRQRVPAEGCRRIIVYSGTRGERDAIRAFIFVNDIGRLRSPSHQRGPPGRRWNLENRNIVFFVVPANCLAQLHALVP